MKKVIKPIIYVCVILAISLIRSFLGSWEVSIYDSGVNGSAYGNFGRLSGNSYIEQSFYCEMDGLEGVLVQPVTFGQTDNGALVYQLIDAETQETVAEGSVATAGWEDAKFTEIPFKRIEQSKDKEYILRIQADNTPDDRGISFYTTQKQENTSLSLNGEDRDECLVLKTVHKTFNLEEFIVFAGLLAYILLFIKLLYKFLR
ncbi:MAG TPA: hypothetical protein H9935_07570 [Candidatus Blautia merdigallinarum]|uniref:Uncharacterized protein n=1 Tax=Candidatus Blautia merdigallinarum TaxID=2838495 RepID=A0A9D2SJT3_9FIRM|nr:hypothetical protein [Candidatus Blautia merdigallinarum]